MIRDMKYTIRIITLLAVLIMSGVGEAWAQLSTVNIKKKVLPEAAATANCDVDVKSVDATTRLVTITVKPQGNYFIRKSDIKVEKLIDPALAPRRATSITEPIDLEDGGPSETAVDADYTFIVPADYTGALVTATFTEKTTASAKVKANDLVYNQQSQALFTVTDEVGGKVKFATSATAPDNEWSTTIPTGTNAGKYTYYFKIDPDAGYSAVAAKDTSAIIKKAKLTKVKLAETAKQYDNGSELTFGVSEVKAGELTVPAEGYNVSGNTQTAVGSYQATVTGIGNYEGEVKATFQIVASDVILVTSATQATELDGHYILTENVTADVFANLYDGDFTGVLDGDMYTISGLSHALFNKINGGTVKNVMLDGVNITSGTNVGAIANEVIGQSNKKACIYNCGVLSGSVSGSGKVGGLVGVLGQIGTTDADKANCYARVINCFNYADIKGGNYKSGIVGYNCYATNTDNLRSMVMNCMFYGDILNVTSGDHVAPIYGGTLISNKDSKGVGNYNYFRAEATYIENQKTGVTYDYNCALMAETRYLQRFEFFRHLLNAHREVAAWWATDDRANKDQIMKWVLEPSQIGSSTPYPILKRPGKYPSVVNIDAEHAVIGKPRNQGGKLGELTVNIRMGDGGAVFGPSSTASITTNRLTLNITDKDTLHYNFNYYKVQLPYYNDVGTGNYRLGSDGSKVERQERLPILVMT